MVPAPARDIYDAWLDSIAHSEMTQAAAIMLTKVGAEISAWNGNITGRNLALAPGEYIVQSWRTRYSPTNTRTQSSFSHLKKQAGCSIDYSRRTALLRRLVIAALFGPA
jgi:hypothetical protein